MVKEFVKVCSKCKQEKSLDLFYLLSKSKGALRACCKTCTISGQSTAQKKEYQKAYYFDNSEKFKKVAKDYRKKNAAKLKLFEKSRKLKRRLDYKEYDRKNSEKKLAYRRVNVKKKKVYDSSYKKKYRKDKDNLASLAANSAKYRANKLQATPHWLTVQQNQEIKNIYKKRPEGYHVDHIVPLQGLTVSGLHVPWNLQYLQAKENIRKSNRLGDMYG